MKKNRGLLRNLPAGAVATLVAFGMSTGTARAANVISPMLLTFKDLPGIWAPDNQDCEPYIYQSLIRYHYHASSAVETCLHDRSSNLIDEALGLWPTHNAAEAVWHRWLVSDEAERGVNRVTPHRSFPVPVVFDENTASGPAFAFWNVTAVKGRVLILLNYSAGPRVNPVISIFQRALTKVRGT